MNHEFKSLPKNARDYSISNLKSGNVIYCPDSRKSYPIKKVGNNGYLCVNQQTGLTCFLELQVFTDKCYTNKL